MRSNRQRYSYLLGLLLLMGFVISGAGGVSDPAEGSGEGISGSGEGFSGSGEGVRGSAEFALGSAGRNPTAATRSAAPDPSAALIFPRAFGIAVNQVGYMYGDNLSGDDGVDLSGARNGAFRAGIRRNFDVRDYHPFVEVGQAVGVRFMTLFVLADMDRLNIVAEYPTATEAGADFDNSDIIGPDQIEIMDFVTSNAAHIELGVTGVGHEYWENGLRTRSEWYNVQAKEARPESEMRGRMELIGRILAQYGISPERGHSFPESMSAYGYHWNPGGEVSTGRFWSESGVKYGNTKFRVSPHMDWPEAGTGGFDHGVLVFDRFDYGNYWHVYADLPDLPDEPEQVELLYETDLIESHWANWLAPDDFLQPALNEEWIDYFSAIQAHPNHYLAKNTEQLYSQWRYRRHTSVSETAPGTGRIDNRGMADEAYASGIVSNLVLAVPLGAGQHVSAATLDGESVSGYFEEAGFGYIYLPPLEKRVYRLNWEIGSHPLPMSVNNSGTYNVYRVTDTGDRLSFELKMYGTQTVEVRTPEPSDIRTDNEHLEILSTAYDRESEMLSLEIRGRDIQGETGTVTLSY